MLKYFFDHSLLLINLYVNKIHLEINIFDPVQTKIMLASSYNVLS